MEKLFGELVFSVGEKEYYWEDIVLAAKLRGDWVQFENELRQGIACLKYAQATDYSPPVQEVTLRANDFRYKRSLITAEETETWLKRCHLTVDDWMGSIRRSLLRKRWADNLGEIVSTYSVPDKEMRACARSEALCGGYFARFANDLAGRAAVHEKLKEQSDRSISRERIENLLGILLEQVDSRALESLTSLPLDRLANLATLEAAFEEISEGCLTPEALRTCVAANRIDWIELNVDYVAFADERAAREGALCVKEDLMTLAEVAADAQQILRHTTLYIDELEGELKSAFLACAKGELLGPVSWEEQYALFWVVDKTMPVEDEPRIREKAKQNILGTLVKREITDRVKWHFTLE